jgi:hypothetical protein
MFLWKRKLTRNGEVLRDVLGRVLEFYAVTSLVLRCVKSGIGTFHESVPVGGLGPSKSGNSEAGGRPNRAAPKSKVRIFKLLSYSLDRSVRAAPVGMGHH